MRRTSAPERASADWWPSQYERDEIVSTIRKRAYSGGEEDEAKAYKILGQKDEINKSCATRDLQVPWSWHYIKFSNINFWFIEKKLIWKAYIVIITLILISKY